MIKPIVSSIVNPIISSITGLIDEAAPLNVSDVFSTELWSGAGTRIDDIDHTEGETLFWTKSRTALQNHILIDTVRGINKVVNSDTTNAEDTNAVIITGVNSDGYTTGIGPTGDIVTWAYKKAAKFLDIITYTGNSAAGREIPHNLEVVPGLILVSSRTSSSFDWAVQHISRGGTENAQLNLNAAFTTNAMWNNTAATDNVVTLNSFGSVNKTGNEYIMYVFAHDPLATGIIQCGQYIGNGNATGPVIELGWKPQYIMIKRAVGGTGDWIIIDTARGIPAGNDPSLAADSSAIEVGSIDYADLTATGFDIATADGDVNANSSTYIYIAIREE